MLGNAGSPGAGSVSSAAEPYDWLAIMLARIHEHAGELHERRVGGAVGAVAAAGALLLLGRRRGRLGPGPGRQLGDDADAEVFAAGGLMLQRVSARHAPPPLEGSWLMGRKTMGFSSRANPRREIREEFQQRVALGRGCGDVERDPQLLTVCCCLQIGAQASRRIHGNQKPFPGKCVEPWRGVRRLVREFQSADERGEEIRRIAVHCLEPPIEMFQRRR